MSTYRVDDLVAPPEDGWVDECSLPPEQTEEEWASFVEQLIAADPELRSEPSASEVIASAQDEPITAGAISSLSGVDLASVSDADVVGLMVGWSRIRNHVDARLAAALLEVRRRTPGNELIDADELTMAEVSAALRLGSGAADRLTRTTVRLAARFPATFAAVEAGDVSWAKATTLVEQTDVLDDHKARQVEERVLPQAAQRTPARHTDAVRRAVDRIDPDAAEERRRRAQLDIELVRRHLGDSMGELFARLGSEQLDTIWLGADAWARRHKAAGDSRTLGQLRVAALVQWAQSFLVHGDPSRCDYTCESSADSGDGQDGADGARPPTRHGRAVRLRVIWDVESLLGLRDGCGELADTGATLTPQAMRDLLAGGASVRRLLVDATTGELLDVTTSRCALPAWDNSPHPTAVELHVVITTAQRHKMNSADDGPLARAVAVLPDDLRAVLLAPITAPDLDQTPDADPAPARLAEFIGIRDRHPTNPSAGLSPAGAGDIDHVQSVRTGGQTVRDNLHSPSRRWHRARTHGGWVVRRVGSGWLWTSWTGRRTTTRPHDYRLGP